MDGKTFITESPDARSQGSKTHSNFFAGRNNMFRSTFLAQDNQIQNELTNVNNKIERGYTNSLHMR